MSAMKKSIHKFGRVELAQNRDSCSLISTINYIIIVEYTMLMLSRQHMIPPLHKPFFPAKSLMERCHFDVHCDRRNIIRDCLFHKL